jgi:hypothetical protein
MDCPPLLWNKLFLQVNDSANFSEEGDKTVQKPSTRRHRLMVRIMKPVSSAELGENRYHATIIPYQ